jgi:hypothetical protein
VLSEVAWRGAVPRRSEDSVASGRPQPQAEAYVYGGVDERIKTTSQTRKGKEDGVMEDGGMEGSGGRYHF